MSEIGTYIQMFFLWGGFMWSLLWHLYCWIPKHNHILFYLKYSMEEYETWKEETSVIERLQQDDLERTRRAVESLELFGSGIALYAFGYFAFGSL